MGTGWTTYLWRPSHPAQSKGRRCAKMRASSSQSNSRGDARSYHPQVSRLQEQVQESPARHCGAFCDLSLRAPSGERKPSRQPKVTV